MAYTPSTSGTIRVKTEYGLNTNYGSTLNTQDVSVTTSNYKNAEYQTTAVSTGDTQRNNIYNSTAYKILNVPLPNEYAKNDFVAANGITYQYKVTATDGTISLTQRQIIYTTTWGIGNYNNTWSTKHTLTITSSNCDTANIALTNRTTQITNTENYLNSLPSVTLPSDKVTQISTSSGYKVNIKTTFSRGSTNNIIKYTTTYGVNGEYNYTLSKDVEFEITSSNYSTWSSDLNTLVTAEHNRVSTVESTGINMMNISSIPSGKSSSYTTNGKTYYYQIAFAQGPADLRTNTFNCTVKWGTSSGNYPNVAAISNIVVTNSNYSSLSTIASNKVTTEESALKTYLNNLPGVTSVTINVVTDYGLSTSYGTTLTSGTVNVTLDNYQNAEYQTTVVSTGDTQRGTITNTNVYKMLNVALPSVATNTSYTATNGVKYQYKVTATNGTSSLTERNIVYTTTWGVGNYNNTWSTTHTLKLTTSNYNTSNITTTNRATQEDATKAYLNSLIGTYSAPSAVTETYSDAPSGLTYYIKTTYSGSNSSLTATSGTLTATTTWGTTSGTYDHSFTDGNSNSVNVTSSNFSSRNTLVANIGSTQRTNLKDYLDTLIGTVSTPSDSTTTFSTASGKTFYVKTTFTGSNNTEVATSCTIKYTTVYGLTDSYGTTLSSNVVFNVTPSNYSTWTTDLASAVSIEQNKVKDLAAYKMLNLSLPSVATNTNYVATNGVTYQYKVTATNGTSSLTERKIIYTTTWGVGNYNNTYGTTHTLTLTTSNYNTSNITTTNRTTQENNTKDYLNTLIGTVSTPSAVTNTFSTASGQTFYVKTTATGSSSSVTATSCTIKYTTVYGLTNSYGSTLSTNVVFTVNANNYKTWTSDYASAVSTEQDKVKNLDTYKMLNVALPSVVTNTNFVADNGITYQYKVTSSYGTCNLSKSEIIYTTTWGVGNYNNTWSTTHTLTLTTSNYSTANITTTNRTTQEDATKAYLNNFIGTVSTPSNITDTFSTASGQTFYVKTTANGSNTSNSATSCTIKYTTVYGLTNSYGNTYSSNLTFNITKDNYSTWASDYADAVATEQAKIKNLAAYKMLNVALPSVATNTSYTATNGTTYQYKVTATNGTSSLTERNIVYTTTWGVGNYNNTYGTTHTLTLTTSNYNTANITTTNRTTQEDATKEYLNTLIGSFSAPTAVTETYSDAPNGITYYIKTTFSGGNSNVSATSATLTATTTWGTTSGTYNQSYSDGNTSSMTITISNLTNRESLVKEIGSTQRTNLKAYLDTLIGTVSTPSDSTTTFSTASGQTFYVKTTFSGSNSSATATSCTIKYTTVYGLTNSYGNTLSTNVEFNITPSNYATWNSDLTSAVSTEQAKVKNLDTYKMLNVALPSVATNTSYTATNGVKYQYKITATNGTSSLTERNIVYTSTWGVGNYNNTWGTTHTLKLTTSNYNTANITTTNRTTQEDATKAYLNTLISSVSTPGDSTTTFSTASGKTFYVKTTASGSNSSITATSCTIKYTTVYGLTNSYGNTLSSNVEFTVTPSNYKTWTSDYASAVSTEQAKVKNLATYKMLNVALPSEVTNTNFTATNGIKYQYKVTATNGTCDLTQRNIIYTTTWGIGNYNNTWGTKNTLKLTTSNYNTANITTTNRATQVNNTEDYLDTLIGTYSAPSQFTETYVNSPSGLTYYIKTTYTGSNNSITATSGTLTATTTWGTSSGTYDHSYSDGNTSSVSVTPSNFANRNTLVTDIGSTQRSNLKNYLDTLIGTVLTPSDKTTTFATNSGKTFYVKTTFSGGNTSVTSTGTTITYTTVYGLSTSYGNTLSSNVEFIVTPDNYTTWGTEISDAVTAEQEKVKNLDTYKMLNITLPSSHSDTYTAVNGKTYSFTSSYSQGTADLTQNNIICTTKYTRQDKTVKTYSSKTRQITPTNHSSATTNLTSDMNTQEQNLKNYLDTLLVMPTKYSSTYNKGGCNYYFEIYYTIPDEESNSVTATAKVDLLTLKSSTVTCSNMSDFNTKKTSMQSTKISEMQNAVSDSPLNTSTTVQGLNVEVSYTKNAITSSSIDGNVYGSISVEDCIVYGPIDFGKLSSFTNYKFVYTTITNTINDQLNEITNRLNSSLPESGSKTYVYKSAENFGCNMSYSYTRDALRYNLSVLVDGVSMVNQSKLLNINEPFKIESRMEYLLSKYESIIKDVTPKDVEQTYNGITISKKFTKNPSSNVVTCDLYVDGVKKSTYTETFDLSNEALKESLQTLGDGDFKEYINNSKSMNISITSSTTVTSRNKTYNVYIATEKVGSKIRVFRVINNIKTNYIDVDIDYLNSTATKNAAQVAANKLLSNLDTIIDFHRPPSEAALIELMKVVTV